MLAKFYLNLKIKYLISITNTVPIHCSFLENSNYFCKFVSCLQAASCLEISFLNVEI